MTYNYSVHAAHRMRQRRIPRHQIEETVEQPEMNWTDKKIKERRIHVRTYGQRRLKVVWIPENHDAFIVTAAWIEGGGRP